MSAVQDTETSRMFAAAFKLHQQGKLQEAAGLYQQVLQRQPEHADALHLLGVIAHQFGNNDSAVTLIAHALQLQPRNAAFHYNLATVYQATEQLEAAIRHYKSCLKFQSGHADAWSNLAVAYLDTDQLQLARQANQQALRLNRKHAGALQNMGTLNYQLGQYDDACKYYDRLLQEHPMLPEVQNQKATIQLLRGDFREGWKNFRWRYFSPEFIARNPSALVPFPLWSGQSLPGRILLLNGDQGVGDVVMFASCLPDVFAVTQEVMLQCDPRLVPLMQRSFPQLKVVAKTEERDFYWQEKYGAIAYRLNLSDLGMFFRQDIEAFPKRGAYLQVDAEKQRQWQTRVESLGAGLKIGISWRGGAGERAKKGRSIPLSNWKQVAELPGVHLINLQYGEHQQEIDQFNAGARHPLHCFDELDALRDIDGFAALVKSLDLVISVDNSTVHIAGALDVPVWVLLPLTTDWRWLLKREDSPWYAAARLFRAEALGGPAMIKALKSAVKALTAQLQQSSALSSAVQSVPESAQSVPEPPASDSTVAEATAAVPEAELESLLPPDYALLLNDTTSWYHWGCSCTSLAIHEQLRQRYPAVVSVPISDTHSLLPCPVRPEQFDDDGLYAEFSAAHPGLIEKISKASVVVINGEGTLHGMSHGSLMLLYLIWLAKTRLHRRVCLINQSSYPDGSRCDPQAAAYALYQKVYAQVDYIAVRESVSLQEFAKLGIEAVQSFDSLPLFIETQYQRGAQQNDEPYIVLAGSVAWGPEIITEIGSFIVQMEKAGIRIKLLIGANAWMASDDLAFVEALAPHLGGNCNFCLAGSEAEWLDVLAGAQLLVSGRFHHTIAAAFLGRPFVVMASNTPKIQGLLQMLELDAYLDSNAPQLAERLHAEVKQVLEQPADRILAPARREALLALARRNYTALEAD